VVDLDVSAWREVKLDVSGLRVVDLDVFFIKKAEKAGWMLRILSFLYRFRLYK